MADTDQLVDFPLPILAGPAPAQQFTRLRKRDGLTRVRLPDGQAAWLASRYMDNRRLLGDPRFSRAAATAPAAPRLRKVALESASITTMDPPEHSRIRGLVAGEFAARKTAQLVPRIKDIATSLAQGMQRSGPPADLVARFAQPLAFRVICQLLGVPEFSHASFRAWSDTYLGTTGATAADITRASARLKEFLAALIAAKRTAPADDLLSSLLAARAEDRLSGDELVALALTLLVAGYQTASSSLAGSVQVLLSPSGQFAALRAESGLFPTTVEECLRYVAISASGGTIRIATSDVMLGGTLVRAGEAVMPATTSANRDPAVFPEPDQFDIRRDPNPHLAFGHGAHHCLGAALARAELRAALETLLAFFPDLHLADPGQPPDWHTGRMIRGPGSLLVAWNGG
jgi:nocardicin N-oxygenase